MGHYLIRRLLLAIPLLFAVITLIFVLVEVAPGDAADRFLNPEMPPEVRRNIMEKWGLDQPPWVRYGRMMKNLMTGDFGRSLDSERPVLDLIRERLPNTLLLGATTLGLIYLVGVVVGTIQAVRQHRPADSILSAVTLFFYSMPDFWLGLMLMLVFSLKLGWLPSSGMKDPVWHDQLWFGGRVLDIAKHLVLPGVALGIAYAGGIARYMRSSMLEVIRQDYVRTARAKGLSESAVILRHALRNALIPIVTLLGLSLPALFSGAVVVETIFAWPGMGRLIVESIFAQDLPALIGCFFFSTLLVVAGNLLADVLYTVVDPRIKYT
jgi:peptide/nickel transport system permease protein